MVDMLKPSGQITTRHNHSAILQRMLVIFLKSEVEYTDLPIVVFQIFAYLIIYGYLNLTDLIRT